jgi:hypothetical protein
MLTLLALSLAIAAPHATNACATAHVGKRTGHSLAYDAGRRQVVMFGGISDDEANPLPRSLWAWTGERWECVDDSGPPGRRDAFLAYDAGRKRLVLFGGRVITRDRQMRFLRDTWEWDGAAWKQVDTAGPAPRIHGAVAYDARRKGIVVHSGGGADDLLRDTWLWNGARWDSLPVVGPRGIGNSMFSAPNGVAVLSALFEESAECSGLMRAQLNELRGDSLVPLGEKGPCYSPQAPAARTANGFLLFASWEPRNAAITWLFSNGAWRRADTSPPRRRGSQAAFDEARQRVVVYGGDDDTGLLGDTWEWTGALWVRRN